MEKEKTRIFKDLDNELSFYKFSQCLFECSLKQIIPTPEKLHSKSWFFRIHDDVLLISEVIYFFFI